MLNWENKVNKKLKISEILGVLENFQEPTLRDTEVLGLYWYIFNGHDFLKTRKSLQELEQNSINPFCCGHNIFTVYKNNIDNFNILIDEEYFNLKLKELEKNNRSKFLIDTIHKSYFTLLSFQIK